LREFPDTYRSDHRIGGRVDHRHVVGIAVRYVGVLRDAWRAAEKTRNESHLRDRDHPANTKFHGNLPGYEKVQNQEKYKQNDIIVIVSSQVSVRVDPIQVQQVVISQMSGDGMLDSSTGRKLRRNDKTFCVYLARDESDRPGTRPAHLLPGE
jgi:LmbE family N-acetylglucosaminyl deacetylase